VHHWFREDGRPWVRHVELSVIKRLGDVWSVKVGARIIFFAEVKIIERKYIGKYYIVAKF